MILDSESRAVRSGDVDTIVLAVFRADWTLRVYSQKESPSQFYISSVIIFDLGVNCIVLRLSAILGLRVTSFL